MERISLPGTGVAPSAVALGTATFGSAVPEETAFRIMDLYAERGGTCIDTAHVYASWLPQGEGASERTVGRWLARAGGREGLVISTKGAHPDMKTGERRVRRDCIRSDLGRSLERLGLERVDIYWLHRDDPAVPAGEILGWLEELMGEGLVRAVGCSNWIAPRQREARRAAAERGLRGFAASQVGWSLAERSPDGGREGGMLYMDAESRAFHEETGTPLFAYSSQANGFFAGKYDRAIADPSARCDPHFRRHFITQTNVARLAAARALAERKRATPNQIALAWLRTHSFPVVAVIGPRTLEQAADSCDASGVSLTADEAAFLTRGG